MVGRIAPKPVSTFEVKPQQEPPTAPALKPLAQRFGNEFSSGRGSALRAKALSATGATPTVVPTSLLTESIGDGKSNCLERAFVAAKPGDGVTLLRDSRDAIGHAVVERSDGKVFDPASKKTFASMKAYLDENPRYSLRPEPQARGIPQKTLATVFDAPPRSAQRMNALRATGLSTIAATQVADLPTEPGRSWPKGPLSRSEEVSPLVDTMQQRLISLGYLTTEDLGTPAGRFGANTESAVRLFQTANGLKATGIADTKTLALMGSTPLTLQNFADKSATSRIGTAIGTAGPGLAPTLESIGPNGTIGDERAKVRDEPDLNEAPQGVQIPAGTPVTITVPQPEGAAAGWLHVSAQVDGQAVTGWVANGVSDGKFTYDRIVDAADPRVDQRLKDLGYVTPRSVADHDAIRNFQLMNGLPGTGELDDKTLTTMWAPEAVQSNHVRQVFDEQWNQTSKDSTSANCGPTSVAMALAAVGLAPIDNANPQTAIDAMRKEMGGSVHDTTGTTALEAGIAAGGGESYRVDSKEDVLVAVSNGDPVVLFGWHDDPVNDKNDTWHWVTVQGYDADTKKWLVSDPLSRTGVAEWTDAQFEAYANYDDVSVAVVNPGT